jgi:hypothetical protein
LSHFHSNAFLLRDPFRISVTPLRPAWPMTASVAIRMVSSLPASAALPAERALPVLGVSYDDGT